MIMDGGVKLRWMRWAKVMLGWRVIGAEARVTWPKSAARRQAWSKVGKERPRINLEKGRSQRAHGRSEEEIGKGKRSVGKEMQMLLAKVAEVGKDIKELAGRVARSVTKLTKDNVVAVKGWRRFKRCKRKMEVLQERCQREGCGRSVQSRPRVCQ